MRLIRGHGGDAAVAQMLALAGSDRDAAYLEVVENWVSLDEACALLAAGVQITGDELFARRVGEHAIQQHAGKQVATMLRSLGSVEAVLQAVAKTAGRVSTVTDMEAIEVGPGRAIVSAVARAGFPRRRLHCDWTTGSARRKPRAVRAPGRARRGERMPGARGQAVQVHRHLGRRARRRRPPIRSSA